MEAAAVNAAALPRNLLPFGLLSALMRRLLSGSDATRCGETFCAMGKEGRKERQREIGWV